MISLHCAASRLRRNALRCLRLAAPVRVRHYSDGMDKFYQPNLFTKALSSATLGLYLGWPYLMVIMFILRCGAMTRQGVRWDMLGQQHADGHKLVPQRST